MVAGLWGGGLLQEGDELALLFQRGLRRAVEVGV